MAVGGSLGYYIVDRYLDTYPWGMITLILLGAAAGFYEIFRILAQDSRSKS
jgi:F0F1-type ATP synthase assembly protein I